jgi:hypothetical protein
MSIVLNSRLGEIIMFDCVSCIALPFWKDSIRKVLQLQVVFFMKSMVLVGFQFNSLATRVQTVVDLQTSVLLLLMEWHSPSFKKT